LVEGPRQDFWFVAEASDPRDRLDKFVVERMSASGVTSSRATVQRWIHAERVTLDGRSAAPSESVHVGAVVQVRPLPPPTTDLEPDKDVAFDILFEDAHLVVVDKPGGLVVHPARGHETGTLVHGLLARTSFERVTTPEGDAGGSVRPGIVHRLDKGTSGVMVVAKDERTREGLKALFSRHDIERAYLAIVVGAATDRTFETLHGRHRKDRLKFTSRVTTGKRAVTHVSVLERLGSLATLVVCRLETGRTHQIRVHLSECGKTPILGDPVYGQAPRDPRLRKIAEHLGRQALHAAVLGFVHPVTGQKLYFRREPPRDFMSALQELRGAPSRA
jgi:23S rRNA pseudouridine1911/1915/1917 synthase